MGVKFMGVARERREERICYLEAGMSSYIGEAILSTDRSVCLL